jgi:hypothetical protein
MRTVVYKRTHFRPQSSPHTLADWQLSPLQVQVPLFESRRKCWCNPASSISIRRGTGHRHLRVSALLSGPANNNHLILQLKVERNLHSDNYCKTTLSTRKLFASNLDKLYDGSSNRQNTSRKAMLRPTTCEASCHRSL